MVKKLVISIVLIVGIVGCKQEKTIINDTTKVDIYKEVEKIAANMQGLQSFRLEFIEDVEYPTCDEFNNLTVYTSNPNPVSYEVVNHEGQLKFRSTQQVQNEKYQRIIYYKEGHFFREFTGMAGSYQEIEGSVDNLILHPVFKQIDTSYFDVKKTQEGENTRYTFTLTKPEKYSAAYPDDHSEPACGITGYYVSQKYEVVANKEGYMLEQHVEEVVHYTQADQTFERLNTTNYKFYDFNADIQLEF